MGSDRRETFRRPGNWTRTELGNGPIIRLLSPPVSPPPLLSVSLILDRSFVRPLVVDYRNRSPALRKSSATRSLRDVARSSPGLSSGRTCSPPTFAGIQDLINLREPIQG